MVGTLRKDFVHEVGLLLNLCMLQPLHGLRQYLLPLRLAPHLCYVILRILHRLGMLLVQLTLDLL